MGGRIDDFLPILEQYHSVLAVFKIFLLLHRLAFEGQQSQTALVGLLGELSYSPKGDFEKLLAAKLM
jgi:hypothetical protein